MRLALSASIVLIIAGVMIIYTLPFPHRVAAPVPAAPVMISVEYCGKPSLLIGLDDQRHFVVAPWAAIQHNPALTEFFYRLIQELPKDSEGRPTIKVWRMERIDRHVICPLKG